MSDLKKELQGLFSETIRFSHFGDALIKMHVQGFRCHTNTVIEVQSPITAICGLNGTGKSTLLQLAAVAYKAPANHHRYYVKNFVITGTLDPAPVHAGARLTYDYLQAPGTDGSIKRKTVTVSNPSVKWRGFNRQPQRRVLYAGVGHFIPRVEERDLVTVFARNLQVNGTTDLSPALRDEIGRVVGTAYADAKEHSVTAAGRPRTILTVSRDGSSYSEINMGFGEGRICRLLCKINELPDRSLVLLEEPEISLHPSAQHALGDYLVELCIRKRHQILMTTHSEYLLQALPEQSRIYLHRTANGITVIPGISVAQAASLLAGQHKESLHVLVEDDVAEHIVTELLRKHDPVFLKTVRITQVGSKQDIQTVIKALKDMAVSACAVRDGDAGANPQGNLFKLPGANPPEKEIFQCPTFRQMLKDKFGLNLDDLMLELSAKGHHEWFAELARILPYNYDALVQLSSEAYLASVSELDRSALVAQLKAALK